MRQAMTEVTARGAHRPQQVLGHTRPTGSGIVQQSAGRHAQLLCDLAEGVDCHLIGWIQLGTLGRKAQVKCMNANDNVTPCPMR